MAKYNSFIDPRTGSIIYAPLGGSLIHGTMRNCDLIPVFLDALKETAEYTQLMLSLNGSNWNLNIITDPSCTEWDERWNSEDVSQFCDNLFDILESYAPEGYYFGTHPGDGSDYGYWENEN